jgi:hypothetical protein
LYNSCATMHIVTFPTSHKSIQVYHVTRTADLYMHGERRNFPPSRALGYDASCWRQGEIANGRRSLCVLLFTRKKGEVLCWRAFVVQKALSNQSVDHSRMIRTTSIKLRRYSLTARTLQAYLAINPGDSGSMPHLTWLADRSIKVHSTLIAHPG